ncbi:MAG TPA: NAD-dependent epimerase/dehydratase family protein [Solirubrobacterales bacterium]|nr:NAD-dependent epimerase/dehydratase family protein [Solirubrobacterales bacterium]
MRILILGGDGYLGWPTAMHFSAKDHDVHVVDNYMRREMLEEVSSDSLTPILSLPDRVELWRALTGREIGCTLGDLCDFELVQRIFSEFQPEAIVHYGEQPSAPYSMGSHERAVRTQVNNVVNTLNVLYAMRDICPEAHLIKLGTMGEYGTPNIDIEEGFIEITHNGRSDTLPFPKLPHSLYHCSKVHDSTNIHFASRVWGTRATDLNQGVVYGAQTPETLIDERLATRFDYDECFGTALNRFCVQAVIGHPLTVYGSGGQTRGYLNILDTLRCVELAALNPAGEGEYRVFNQFTEQFSIAELAGMVREAAVASGLGEIEVDSCENPRTEKEEHYYNAKHTKLLDLGLEPHLLSSAVIAQIFEVVQRHRDRIAVEAIPPKTRWHQERPEPALV